MKVTRAKLVAIVNEQNGLSKAGNPFNRAQVLFELEVGGYTESYVATAFNATLEKCKAFEPGVLVDARISCEYREWNGKYFQDLTLNDIEYSKSM